MFLRLCINLAATHKSSDYEANLILIAKNFHNNLLDIKQLHNIILT